MSGFCTLIPKILKLPRNLKHFRNLGFFNFSALEAPDTIGSCDLRLTNFLISNRIRSHICGPLVSRSPCLLVKCVEIKRFDGHFAALHEVADDLRDLRRSAHGDLVVKWYVDD